MKVNQSSDIGELLHDRPRVDRALRRAIRDAMLQHKLLGYPIAVYRDGKVVWIPPEEIKISDDDGQPPPDPTA